MSNKRVVIILQRWASHENVNIYHIFQYIYIYTYMYEKVSTVYIFQCFQTRDKKGEIVRSRRFNKSTNKPIFFQFIIMAEGMRAKRAGGRVELFIYYYFSLINQHFRQSSSGSAFYVRSRYSGVQQT